MALIIVLQNISDLAPISDYKYEVLIGDGGPRSKSIERGHVRGHHRTDGWQVLVDKFLHSRKPTERESEK